VFRVKCVVGGISFFDVLRINFEIVAIESSLVADDRCANARRRASVLISTRDPTDDTG
jgi:hypothetical protein